MSRKAQVPLQMEDFIDYHASGFMRHGAGSELAKSMAAVKMNEIFQGANGNMPLSKALSTTGIVATDATTGGDALKVEDMVEEIMSTELTAEKYAPTFKWITKKPCKSDVVQKTNMGAYGGSDDLGFVDETASDGGLPALDPDFERSVTPVKWLGQYGQVGRTALAVEALTMGGDPEIGGAMETSSFARLEMLYRTANYHTLWGDNSKNAHEFNGLIQQIADANTTAKPTEYDMAGQPLTQDTLIDLETFLYDNGGEFTDLFAGMKTWRDLKKQLIDQVRTGPGVGVTIGNNPDDYLLMKFGLDPSNTKFHRDKMLDARTHKDGTHTAASGAPTAPTSLTVVASSATPTNQWGGQLTAATYYYAVSAVGVKGESIVTTDTGTSQVIASGEKAVLTITRADTATKYYNIYRGTSATTLQYLDRVKCTGATDPYTDKGGITPNTGTALALSASPIRKGYNTIMFRQLWAIDKIKLPVAAMQEQFVWLLAGTPQVLKAPFNVVIRNIGLLDS